MSATAGRVPDGMFDLLCYLITSARGLLDEPRAYGPFRLVDAASRLIECMDEYDDEFMGVLAETIEEKRFIVNKDEAKAREFLDELCVLLARELKQR